MVDSYSQFFLSQSFSSSKNDRLFLYSLRSDRSVECCTVCVRTWLAINSMSICGHGLGSWGSPFSLFSSDRTALVQTDEDARKSMTSSIVFSLASFSPWTNRRVLQHLLKETSTHTGVHSCLGYHTGYLSSSYC